VEGGPPAILKRLAAGKMTSQDVEVLKTLYKPSYDEICTKVAARCADRKNPLSYAQRVTLGRLLDMPTDPTLAPAFVQAMQESFAKHPDSGAPPAAGKGPAPRKSAPAKLSISGSMRSPIESAMGGEAA